MGLVSHAKLDRYLEEYSKIQPVLHLYDKQELYRVRNAIEEPKKHAAAWFATLQRDKFKLSPKKQALIVNASTLLESISKEVLRLIVGIEEDEALDREWEDRFFLESKASDKPPGKYRLLSPFEGKDLTSVMDDTWFPVPMRGKVQ